MNTALIIRENSVNEKVVEIIEKIEYYRGFLENGTLSNKGYAEIYNVLYSALERIIN